MKLAQLVHAIPVGGDEPLHFAAADCWCFPIADTVKLDLMVHNAFDLREARERFGRARPDEKWVLVLA